MDKKVVQLTYSVNKALGELPFRRYHSSVAVQGGIYTIMSKLTKENKVDYDIYVMEDNNIEKLSNRVVTMDEFFKVVQAVDDKIKAINSNARMIEMFDESVALVGDSNGVVHEDKDLVDMFKTHLEPKDITSSRIRKYQ